MLETKNCFKCKENKPLDNFVKAKQNKDGLAGRCRECDKLYREEFYSTKPAHYRRAETLKRVYGISWEDYQKILTTQNSSCAVCFKHETFFKKGLAVDHDHSTGQIRGLLCGACNRWIVGRHKTGELLRNAAEYLDAIRQPLFVPEEYKTGVRRKRKKK